MGKLAQHSGSRCAASEPARLAALVGLACACTQSLLDRSGIISYGGSASSFPQQTVWLVLVVASALAVVGLAKGRSLRIVVFLGVFASFSTLLGSGMIVATSWSLGQGSQLLVDILTVVLAASRAVVFQLGVYCMLSDGQPVRFLVSTGVLCFALTLLIIAPGIMELQVVGYLAATIGSALLVSVAAMRVTLSKDAVGGKSEVQPFGPRALGAKQFAGFCVLQLLPTVLTGSVCVIEMYRPFEVVTYQQLSMLVSGALLGLLFLALFMPRKNSIPNQLIVVVPVVVVLLVAVPLGSSEVFAAKPFFLLMTHFGAAVGYLHAFLAMKRHGTDALTTAFWGQMILFAGMLVGSSLTSIVLTSAGVRQVTEGMYLGVTLGALLALLVALLAMIVFAQQGEVAVPGGRIRSSSALGRDCAFRAAPALASDEGREELDGTEHINDFSRDYGLTSRESEVLVLLGSGYSRKRMAEELGVSEATVKTHLGNLYAKLGVGKRDEALDLWRVY